MWILTIYWKWAVKLNQALDMQTECCINRSVRDGFGITSVSFASEIYLDFIPPWHYFYGYPGDLSMHKLDEFTITMGIHETHPRGNISKKARWSVAFSFFQEALQRTQVFGHIMLHGGVCQKYARHFAFLQVLRCFPVEHIPPSCNMGWPPDTTSFLGPVGQVVTRMGRREARVGPAVLGGPVLLQPLQEDLGMWVTPNDALLCSGYPVARPKPLCARHGQQSCLRDLHPSFA